MKFYELPPEVNNKISDTDMRPYVRIAFEKQGGDVFVNDSDILECVITSYKSTDGGIINYGEIIFDNTNGSFDTENDEELKPGLGIEVWYCFGDNSSTFFRFHLFVDDDGFQSEATGFLDRTCKIKLVDLSSRLDNAKLQRNWTDSETVVDSVVCDKTNPTESLVHIIARRGGIEANQINCGYLPFNIPYVVLNNTVWKELCALARAYDAVVECGRDMTLSFIESPYDTENEYSEETGFDLTEKEITHYRFFSRNDNYANNVRLKYTRYVRTERQELWQYSDAPAWYDEDMQPYYPFTDDNRAIIRDTDYQAIYVAKNEEGKTRNVVWADSLTTEQEFIDDMIVSEESEKLGVIQFDTTTYKDRAVIQLTRNNNLIALYKAAIYGSAIISETNFSVYVKDDEEIAQYGQIAKNITSKFLSDDEIEGVPFYEQRANDLLRECVNKKSGWYVTTFLCLVGARVGAFMNIRLNENKAFKKVRIDELTLRYKKDCAFSTELWLSD